MSSNELISLTSELLTKSNKKNSKTLLLTNELEELRSNILSIIDTSSSDTNNANSITNPSEISLEKYNQLAQELRLREEEVKTQKNLINFYEFNLKNCLNEFYFKLLKIKANSVNNSYNNHHIQNLVNENLMLKGYIDQFKQHLVELMELDSEEANVDKLVDKLAEVNSQNINSQNAELVQLREENEALRYLLGISSDPNLEGFSEDQLQTLTKQLIEGIESPEKPEN